SLLARVQPCGLVHRDRRRHAARRARRCRPYAAAATADARRRCAMKLVVPAEAAGERLDRFLSTHLGSRAAAERAVEVGALVDGVARAKSFRLEGGEAVELAAEEPAAVVPPPPTPRIVWED